MYFVYVLHSQKDKKLYIGYTANLDKRIKEHSQGKALATRNRRPLEVIYYEVYIDKKDAKGRELFLKSGSGHKFLKKQLVNYWKQANK